jgi:hypothetical protein
MAIKAFNSIAGFSVGNVPANIILGNGDITARNANFSGNGNIVGNIYTGNANLGNLAIANYFVGNFQGRFGNGNSNIDIPTANGNINLSSGGNANILVITPTGAYIQGTLDVSGNANVGNVLITTDSITIGNSVLDANGLNTDNANITGNANIGNVAITPDAINIGDTALDANGLVANTANIGNANIGNANISNANIAGNADIGNVAITPDAINIGNTALDANGLVANTANIGNVAITPDAVNIGNTALDANGLQANSANIVGNLSSGNGNFDNLTANFANIDSNLYVLDTANIGNVRTDNLLYANGQPWDLQQAAGFNTWIQYNDGSNNFGASQNLTYDDANGIFTVGVNANISGNVAISSNLSVSNNIQAGYINVIGNINASNGFFAGANVTGNIYGNNFSSVNDLTVGANANIIGNLVANNISITRDLGITGNANVTSNVNANNINASNNVNAIGNLSGNYILGNGFYLTDINTSIISNGNSNVKVFQNSNVAISVAGNSNVLIISGTGINVTSTINSGNITANGNISANAIAVTDANVSNATVSGSVVTAQITAPVGNITISAVAGNSSIFLQPTGNGTVDVNNTRITSLAEPNNATDAATKQYVDTTASGLHVHQSANAATPNTLANITGGTVVYNQPGPQGVGANLVISGGTLTQLDGVTLTANMRLLIKNEANQVWNGVYTYNNTTVITRSTDFDTDVEVAGGDYLFVTSGTIYADSGWVQSTDNVVIGVSNIVFTQFSGAGTYTAGPGIALNGTQFSANTDGITTGIVGSNIVVRANAEFTTPNIGAATGTSLIVTGNLSGNNLSISNIANIGLDLNVTGNIQGNSISSNGNVTGNNLSATNNVSAGANIIGSNITSNNSIIANANITANAGLYGNTLDLNLSANILGNIYTGASKINEIVNPADTTLEIRGGWNNTAGILNLTAGDYGNNVNWAKIGIVGNSSGNAIIDNEANISYWKTPGGSSNVVTINTVSLNSSGFNTGALVVTGGVGISGDLNANGNVVLGNLAANVTSTSFNSGALVTYGGAGIGGNLNILGNISTGGNIVAQGNATLSTSVTLGNTSVAWANVTTTSTAANQTLANLQITGSTITGIEFLVKGVELAGAKYSVASLLLVTDGSNVNWTTYGTVRLGGSTGDLAAGTILDGGNNYVQLWITPSSANSTQWVTQYRTI